LPSSESGSSKNSSSKTNDAETNDNGANSKEKEKPEKENEEEDEESKLDQPTNSSSYSSRNDLIRDIESHIEIIFECFDLDDSVVKPESSSADSSVEIPLDVTQEADKSQSAENADAEMKRESD
jgi:hypothetical protein